MAEEGPNRYDVRWVTQPELTLQTVAKNEDGEKEVEYFEPPFRPYCYVEDRDDESYRMELVRAMDESGCEIGESLDKIHVESRNPVITIEGDSPWDIRDFKRSFEYETFESDVPFARRVMIDMDLKVDIPDWEDILYFDIECVHKDSTIHIADGQNKSAKDVEVGDTLIGWDNGEWTETTVRAKKRTTHDESVEIHAEWGDEFGRGDTGSSSLDVSRDHPVYTQRGWVEAGNLADDDRILVMTRGAQQSITLTDRDDIEQYDRTGQSNPMYDHDWSDDSLDEISESMRGHTPWNKGHSRSDRVKAKISRATQVAMESVDMSGENNPMYGKSLDESTRSKIGESVSETLDRPGGPFGPSGPSDDTRKKMLESAKARVKRDGVYNGSTFYSDALGHEVRSGWEEAIGILLDEYEYEPRYTITVDRDERSYFPDFETDEMIIEVSGFMTDNKREKLSAFMNVCDKEFVLVGAEGPCDTHIPFEQREILADGGFVWADISIEQGDGGTYYDFSCDEVSNFFADYMLVHNCDPRGEFPDPDEAKKQIISIAGADGDGNEFFICHDDEEEILREFKELIQDYYILVGWNSGTFDWPYIKARMELMPFDIDYFQVIHFDLQYLMQHINREERPSWALDAVGEDEVGMGKTMSEEDHEMGYEVLWHWYENDRETLEEYNVEDCKIVGAIDDKYNLIRLIFRICRRGYSRPDNIMYRDDNGRVRIAVGKACDSVVLSVVDEYVFNDQYKYADLHDFPGGKVFDPIPGTYHDVMTADFSGMYPAIIKDFNIGPNTWIDTDDVDEAVEMARERWNEDIDESDLISGVGPKGVGDKARGFFINPEIERSVLAEAIDEVEDLRMEFKQMKKDVPKGTVEWHMYNNIDRGLKVLMNTFYGIFASPKKRYYIPGMSENVTEIGQYLITQCFDWAEDNVIEVEKPIYGDTDSVMLELNVVDQDYEESDYMEFVDKFIEDVEAQGSNSLDLSGDKLRRAFELVQVARSASEKMNRFIVDFVQDEHGSPGNHMEMDLDDVWRNYLITTKKKKYAGEVVYDDGPCAYRKIKGFKCIKANTSEAVSEFQKRLIQAKLHGEATTPILDEYKHKLFTGQFDVQMIQWTRLNKMPSEYETLMAHARAARMMIEREGDKGAVRTGDKIQYLKYGDDVEMVEPTDDGITDWRENDGYCSECDQVINSEHEHETLEYPKLRPRHYSYLWGNRFEPTMDLLRVSRHEQTGLEAFA